MTIYADMVCNSITSIASAGEGTITLSGSGADIGDGTTGRTFSAALGADAAVTIKIKEDTAWEICDSAYTHSGTTLTRGTLRSSSTGARVAFTSAAKVFLVAESRALNDSDSLLQMVTPGGRLTLESGVPVSTTDQTGKTNVYYTPYTHDGIALWDGTRWRPIKFTEYTLALGTLTDAKNYDVLAYLNSGVLALELLAWNTNTARTTGMTLQDGRYCKSGDKTRLYLGTIRTTSTTTTEDSGFNSTSAARKRFVWNAYNRIKRVVAIEETTASWTLASPFAVRQVNANARNQVEAVCGLTGQAAVDLTAFLTGGINSIGSSVYTNICYDSTSTADTYAASSYSASYSGSGGTPLFITSSVKRQMELGYHYWTWVEGGNGGGTTATYYGSSAAVRKSQLVGWVEA